MLEYAWKFNNIHAMDYTQFTSIILESIIAVLFLLAAMKGKKYLYGLALTFIIYVFYDLAHLLEWNIQQNMLTGFFFVATLGALYSAWHLYKK